MEIMAAKGTSAIFNPSSNCKLASGFAPITELKKAGVNVGIGTDGTASNDNLNMFEEMHLASLIIKNTGRDATLATAEEILKMATVNGARAMGRTDTGELKCGMKADIIAVSLEKPHMFPAFDIPNILVYSAQASDVVMTMVDGRILYKNGEYTTLDAEKVKAEMQESLNRIYN
jgi:5-methylthioadenosine/S-adenosylhomocysteine deaminase